MSKPPPQLEVSWAAALHAEWEKSYLEKLADFVATERRLGPVYPPQNQVFAAFDHTPYKEVKVVIMGQDPYHGEGQAHGLSFSVPKGVKPPPSLKNIFKELNQDLSIPIPNHGCLVDWAKQGVLLLNAVLTVRKGKPQSHAHQGWEIFTDAVIHSLCEREDPVIFVLWGKSAQDKCRHILAHTTQRHYVLMAPHPSPYSAHQGFFGCGHFSKIQDLLNKQGKKTICWEL
ncbi:MAG: uracil-DNA glycosylase [Verrucomicrobia bacterium]|nr:uracil-DNA glycosylase [Verrucomicrobiota bacterium]MBS0646695.1 uracil-DNA glycosylase [Verrucomicrobiota bacterium]